MERLRLEVQTREGTGKSVTRKMRADGRVPAVLYGTGVDSVRLSVGAHEAERVLSSGANRLIDLTGAAQAAGKLALIKDHQRHPVSRALLHCDFYSVDTNKPVEVSIPVHMTGKPKGVEQGGVLEQIIREIAVSCLPLAIPESVSIDVSELNVGDSLHASDLKFPAGVTLMVEESAPVVHVLAPRVEAEPKAEEAAAAEGAAEGASAEGEKKAE